MYCALIGYIWYEAEPEEKNFSPCWNSSTHGGQEDDEEFQSPVDLLFAKLEKEHPDHFAVKQYRKFKWLREMYALSDFLIMVFVMVSEAVT